jgi:hypothetical protein
VSLGGTSLLFTGISLGIILSVSKYIETTVGEGNVGSIADQVAANNSQLMEEK